MPWKTSSAGESGCPEPYPGIDLGRGRLHPAPVRIDDTLARQGLRPIDVRVVGFASVLVIAATTLVGSLPPSITTGAFDVSELGRIDEPIVPALAGVAAVFFAALIVGPVLAIRLLERRWVWPFGPKVPRPKGVRPSFAGGFAVLGPLVVGRLVEPFLPHASALYGLPGPGDRWLRVVAPEDFASALIVGFILYV
jgi:hypothetical protein